MLNRFLTLGMYLAIVCSCKKDKSPDDHPAYKDLGFKVIAYADGASQINDTRYRVLDIINGSFATVSDNGSLDVKEDIFKNLFHTARANNPKILRAMSIGGSTANFRNMASTAMGRTNFIHAVLEALRKLGIEGVDLDWEYPSIHDGTDSTFTLLIKELSDSCHQNKYFLSAAITHGKYADGYREAFKAEIFNLVDWFNIMAFKDHSVVLPYQHHTPYELAETALHYWIIERGMPKEKCILGISTLALTSGPLFSDRMVPFSSLVYGDADIDKDSGLVDSHASPPAMKVYYNGRPTTKKKTMLAKKMANGVVVQTLNKDAILGSLITAIGDTLGRKQFY